MGLGFSRISVIHKAKTKKIVVFRYHNQKTKGRSVGTFCFEFFVLIEKYHILHQNFIFIVNHCKNAPKSLKKL